MSCQYVCILDKGVTGNRDSHQPNGGTLENSEIHNRNLWGIMNALREEVDAGALNLANTVVHIHSELHNQAA